MKLFATVNKSVRARIMLTLGITILVFLIGYVFFLVIQKRKNTLIENNQQQEIVSAVNAILQAKNDRYEKVCFDYSIFSWMIEFIQHPDKKKGKMTITPPANLGLDLVQIYNLNGAIVYSDFSPVMKKQISIPPVALELLYQQHTISFFLLTPDGLIQLNGSTVHPSDDTQKTSKPQGYIFFGKLWDADYLKDLDKITNCHIRLFTTKESSHVYNVLRLNLFDYALRKIGYLTLSKPNSFLENLNRLNKYFNIFFILFCFLLFVITYNSYRLFVIQPLSKIESSLNNNDIKDIATLSSKDNEFGKIAKLIKEFFYQQSELKNNIEELHSTQQSLQELNKELYNQKTEIEEQNKQLHYLNKEMQSQNEEIVAIADGLQLANLEITDSINYASFIQNAVLAPSYELSRIVPDHFIFYKPKNIVSGDFYWFKEMKNGDRILAVSDCTGHGLSGALLSMLGISFLNQILSQLENEEFSAATVLDSLKNFFIQSLHQRHELNYVQDGMHIALCIFDKGGQFFQYASAFHSVCLVRKNLETGIPELFEHKGNRIPVGIYVTDELFTNYKVELQKGDTIYMFSDGITDQFGGPRNKKYLASRFRDFLLSVSQFPLSEQKERIISEYERWKGIYEQTDDIIVVGIRVS
jgi:serine phosphatase RsbU (regulator of sigma subunit)/sensor domain CHASE-containing protein